MPLRTSLKDKTWILILFLCIPLLFINVRPDHDWGGDFAQYLQEARKISEGVPFYESRYLFNEEAPVYGPPAYPPGYPLLLSPLVKLFGINFQALMIYQSILLVLFGLFSFLFFRKKLNHWTALLLSLVMLYHPWVLDFKSEIQSDIAFAFFFVLLLYLYKFRNDNKLFRVTYLGLLAAFLIQIRSIGIVFILAIGLNIIIHLLRNRRKSQNMPDKQSRFDLSLLIFSLVMWAFFRFVLFPEPNWSESSYLRFILSELGFHNIPANITYYMMVLQQHFSPLSGNWAFLSIVLSSLAILLFFSGILKETGKRPEFVNILFLLYLLVLIIYPYRGSGFRFLLPVLPLFLFYMMAGAKYWLEMSRAGGGKILRIALVIVLFMYIPGIISVIKSSAVVRLGPHKNSSTEVFEYIQEHLEQDAVITFIRPRVLALFTGRYGLGTKYQDSTKEIADQFRKYDVDYILVMDVLKDKNVCDFIKQHERELDTAFINEGFVLYRFLKE